MLPSATALLFFQYYLSASNEAPIDVLAGHIQAAIAERLDPPADAEARAFLARYLDYLAAGDQEFRAPGLADPAALERRLQWVRELRREHFGPALAEHLFGERRPEVLATLRAAHFDESEVHRIRILDRQEATTAPD